MWRALRAPRRSVGCAMAFLTFVSVRAAFAQEPPPTNLALACLQPSVCDSQLNTGLTAAVSSGSGSTAVQAQAAAAYGFLRVESLTNFVGSAVPAYSFGIGYVRDHITISSPSLDGSTGLLFLSYSLEGTIHTSGVGTSVVQVAIDVRDTLSLQTQSVNTAYLSSISETILVPQAFTFTYGQPFRFDLCLGAATGMGIVPAVLPNSGHLSTFMCAPGRVAGTAGNGMGSADFFSGLTLEDLLVTDSRGNPVSGLQLSSQSGTQYGVSTGVSPLPEAHLLLMLGLGLSLIAVVVGQQSVLHEATRR